MSAAAVLSAIFAAAIAWRMICAVEHMTRATRWTIRLACVLLGAGALGFAATSLGASWSPWWDTLFAAGAAMFVYADGRAAPPWTWRQIAIKFDGIVTWWRAHRSNP